MTFSSDQDFPAAHSMDSEWFAVDAKGHVAVFETEENGPLPVKAWSSGRGCSVNHNLTQFHALPYDIKGELGEPDRSVYWVKFRRGLADAELFNPKKHERPPYNSLLWLKNSEAMTVLKAYVRNKNSFWRRFLTFGSSATYPPQVLELNVPGQTVAYFESMTLIDLEALQNKNLWNKVWMNYELEPARFGIYTYLFKDPWDNDKDEFNENTPYSRITAPAHPANVSELPERVSTLVGHLKLSELNFESDIEIDPRKYTECDEARA